MYDTTNILLELAPYNVSKKHHYWDIRETRGIEYVIHTSIQ